MHGCGLRIGEALAVSLRCRINRGETLRVKEQVNPAAQLRPLKFRQEGEFRDIPLPQYVSEAIDKHIAEHGTSDGYLSQGRKYKLVVRRSYQEDFQRAAAKAGLPPEFVPHSLRHLYASTALAEGIPITEVSRWLGHTSIEVTHQIYGHLVPASGNPALNPACSRATKGSRPGIADAWQAAAPEAPREESRPAGPGGRTALSRLGPTGRRAASGSSRCSGLTGQQGGCAYSFSLRWTMASYSCSYVIGGSGIGCARSAR